MDLPALVADHLEDEPVRDRVVMNGDQVVVTPTRTLVYRSEGLLSDEAVSAFPNDVDRLDVATGRKPTFRFSYIDGERSFRVGGDHASAVLRAVLSGVLAAADVVGPDETVREAYRFDQLTLVVTDDRALKHVGAAVWDAEYEAFPFADLTGLGVEEGVHATQLVFEVDGRSQRVKVPADEARLVHRAVESAVLDHYGVDSAAELDAVIGSPEPAAEAAEPGFATGEFEPLVTSDDRDGGADEPDIDLAGGEPAADADPAGSGPPAETEGAGERPELAREVAALREAVEEQNDQLRAQSEAIDRLVAELRGDSET